MMNDENERNSGDSEENVVKLCQHAGLSEDDRSIIKNMQTLGVPVIHEVCLFVCLSLTLFVSPFFLCFYA